MRVILEAQFQLFGVLKKENGWYIAHCPPLDITTQGKTEAEAKRNLAEASELFVVSCFERGTFEQALRELGWSVVAALRHGRENVLGFRVKGYFVFRFQFPLALRRPMSRLNPLPWHKLVCVFEQIGYRQAGQKGSHLKLEKPGVARPLIVPKYGEVGITRDAFLSLLENC